MNDSDQFRQWPDLAAARTGGAALYSTDDFFASMDNLLKAEKAVFLEGEYTERGKWMDGWESRRKREAGYDFCILRLGLPGRVRGLVVDTAFFKGNYPQACSVDGASLPGNPNVATLLSDEVAWTELLPRADLQGDTENLFEVTVNARVTHLRLNIFPDGGVARLRVHGEVVPRPRVFARPELDLASIENGARVVACNDMFFGSRHNLIMPNRAANMGDGWETKRSRRPGPDWVVVALATRGQIHRALVDTLHFRGNSPESCALDVCDAGDRPVESLTEADWREILPRTKLLAHTLHELEDELRPHAPATHVRMRIWPDGGVSRLRLFGVASPAGAEAAGMTYVNALSPADAEATFRSCCGASAFATQMAAARPFASLEAMKAAAAKVWSGLGEDDWDEAFRAHPEIGGKKAEGPQTLRSASWSAGEQAQVPEASETTLLALAEVNARYRERFGRIYIVCATGKTAEGLLAIARARLENAPDVELRAAAEEQRKITELRLEKLVHGR